MPQRVEVDGIFIAAGDRHDTRHHHFEYRVLDAVRIAASFKRRRATTTATPSRPEGRAGLASLPDLRPQGWRRTHPSAAGMHPPMRLVPRSHFCTCWNVKPRASPSLVWLIPSIILRMRTRAPTCLSVGLGDLVNITASLGKQLARRSSVFAFVSRSGWCRRASDHKLKVWSRQIESIPIVLQYTMNFHRLARITDRNDGTRSDPHQSRNKIHHEVTEACVSARDKQLRDLKSGAQCWRRAGCR
jgi:hypothetical protein